METLRYFVVLCLLLYEVKSVHFGYEFDLDANMWFKLHRVGANWHEARRRCNLEGAVLASPSDNSITAVLEAYSRLYNTNQLLTGIHSTFVRDHWYSIEGASLETMTMDHLDISKLSHTDGDCTLLTAGYLKSVLCSEVHPYVCYKRDMPVNPCGTADSEYLWYKETCKCYKFHTNPMTFWDAFKTCAAEHAYLAIINSNVEAQVIKDIFKKYPTEMINSYYSNDTRLGIVDWEKNRKWYTIHGEPLEDTGHYTWDMREPNNDGGEEYCVVIRRNGLLNDNPCSTKVAFICEKDVKNDGGAAKTTGAMFLSTTEKQQRAQMQIFTFTPK